MHNIVVLGSGRSGTSMTAGLFASGGHYMGDHINKPNDTNPKGQFEDAEINQVNEAILERVVNSRPKGWLGNMLFPGRPGHSQRWLSLLKKPIQSAIISQETMARIQRFAGKEPFCYKDPRFSYTLPVWRPYLQNTRYIVVFRHPAATVNSILRQKQKVAHLKGFTLSKKYLFRVWCSMYHHILEVILPGMDEHDYLVIHFDQLFQTETLLKIERLAACPIDHSFPDKRLNRTPANNKLPVPKNLDMLYSRLAEAAGYVQ